MNFKPRLLMYTIALTLATTAGASAQQKIGGLVFTDPAGPLFSGLVDADVILDGASLAAPRMTLTAGASGLWVFEDVPDGDYTVHFSKTDWCLGRVQGAAGVFVVIEMNPISITVDSSDQDNIAANQSIFLFAIERSCGDCAPNECVDMLGKELCSNDNDCSGDGETCVEFLCTSGSCDCESDGDCDDMDPCTDDICDCTCSNPPIDDCCTTHDECDDGDDCTQNTCDENVCVTVDIQGCCDDDAQCDDGEACTTDSCLGNNTCSNQPIEGCCETHGDCDDMDPCTDDVCTSMTCENNAIDGCCTADGDCDDSDDCTTDTCTDNTCDNAEIPECCTTDGECADGDACTADTCTDNVCDNADIPDCCIADDDCDDEQPCTEDSCTDNVCSNDAIDGCCESDGDCDDNDGCTINTCVDNVCVLDDVDCDDQDICTTDACINDICVNAEIPDCCESDDDCVDDSDCTLGSCQDNTCVQEPVGDDCCETDDDCDDGDSCTVNSCDGGVCVKAPLCDDGDKCTIDSCDNGDCTADDIPGCCNTVDDCADDDACTEDTCDDGTCVNDPIAGCCVSDDECDDADECTLDTCIDNVCDNDPIGLCCEVDDDCDDDDACTTDTCVDGTCSNEDISCDDGNRCTTDSCVDGDCVNEDIPNCCEDDGDCREDDDPCTLAACDRSTSMCTQDPIDDCCTADDDCVDGEPCTIGLCVDNTCEYEPFDCDVAALTNFTLVNADSDDDVAMYDPIENGDQIEISNLPNINIRANESTRDPSGLGGDLALIDSVRFDLKENGELILSRIENNPPYALFGDIGGDYNPWPNGGPNVGSSYMLTATPYDGPNGGGQSGEPIAVMFTIVDGGERIVDFTLIDADTDSAIAAYDPLNDDDMISIMNLPNLNVRANSSPDRVYKVWIEIRADGDLLFARIENNPPYALFGDIGGDYNPWPGGGPETDVVYEVAAAVLPGPDADAPLEMTTVTFKFISDAGGCTTDEECEDGIFCNGIGTCVEGSCLNTPACDDGEVCDEDERTCTPTMSVVDFTLIDADDDTVIDDYDPLDDDAVIDLDGLPALSIRANTSPLVVGSVELELYLDGELIFSRIENTPPYALFGDTTGDYNPWPGGAEPGEYTLTATPYSQSDGGGMVGDAKTIDFTIEDSSATDPD